jgi:hypothetical protein
MQHAFLVHMHNVEEVLENVFGDNVCILNNVPPRQMLNALLCKKNTNIYYKAKIISKKKIMAFLLRVIMGLGVIPNEHPIRFTSYGFVMTTLTIALKVKGGYMQHRYANCAYSMAYARRK